MHDASPETGPSAQSRPLAGRRIAVPETRELDVFADLLQRRGAEVLRYPLVSILDAPDPVPVLEWVRRFNAEGADLLILMTGEGVRRLLSCIDQHAPALRGEFLARLAAVRKLARGPKPARALRELGLKPELSAAIPTTAGIIATLQQQLLQGQRVAVQLYGTQPNLRLMEYLAAAGATASTVAPYVYADNLGDAQVLRLIEDLEHARVDAIAFTSQSQVERLFAVAGSQGRSAELQRGLAGTLVAAVGPVVAEVLQKRGVRVDLMPDSFFLKPLTQALCERFM